MNAPFIVKSRRLLAGAVMLLSSLLLAGCATGPNAHPRDPMEPWNRGVYRFNDTVDKALLKPTATVYTKVTPTFMQKGVRNFFNNLGDAWSTVNSILQLRGQDAANSFSRVTINSLFGLGGVFDVATEARIPQSKQDFGLTLGRWGMPSGPYMVLPLLGSSTLRDTAALPIDMKGNPVGAVNSVAARNTLSVLSVVDYRAQMLDASNLLDQAALDPYAFMRDAYLQQRDARAGQAAPAGDAPVSGADDGYEPPPDEVGADDAASQTPAQQAAGQAGYEPPLDESQPVVVPAADANGATTAEEVPSVKTEAAAPLADTTVLPQQVVPAVSGQTPLYWHAVPRWMDDLSPGWGGSFWRH
ncbi:MAG: VacJ family lipoprotein [Brachymonas sp.]|jgi:phospholipid-binding lipoprotein MlaA|nr:VacJ family lipoprotein [Brachymonas sp.]